MDLPACYVSLPKGTPLKFNGWFTWKFVAGDSEIPNLGFPSFSDSMLNFGRVHMDIIRYPGIPYILGYPPSQYSSHHSGFFHFLGSLPPLAGQTASAPSYNWKPSGSGCSGWCLGIKPRRLQSQWMLGKEVILLMEEIPNNHMGWIQTL